MLFYSPPIILFLQLNSLVPKLAFNLQLLSRLKRLSSSQDVFYSYRLAQRRLHTSSHW
jgi:hypothetical protein